jgi:protocatechuate 3,4-dioxygenase beta subunit
MRDADRVSRRRFLELWAYATASSALGTPRGAAADEDAALRETADLITGPFYPVRKPRDVDADLTTIRGHRSRANGQVVQLSGRVLNLRGEPLRDVHLEIWQANTNGRYTHPSDPNTKAALDPDFEGYASVRTDRHGRYAITTIKPGPYPTARGDMRAPHIHFEVQGRTDRKVTQMFFPGEPLNATDRHLNSVRRQDTLLASVSPASTEGVLVATWDLVLTTG